MLAVLNISQVFHIELLQISSSNLHHAIHTTTFLSLTNEEVKFPKGERERVQQDGCGKLIKKTTLDANIRGCHLHLSIEVRWKIVGGFWKHHTRSGKEEEEKVTASKVFHRRQSWVVTGETVDRSWESSAVLLYPSWSCSLVFL